MGRGRRRAFYVNVGSLRRNAAAELRGERPGCGNHTHSNTKRERRYAMAQLSCLIVPPVAVWIWPILTAGDFTLSNGGVELAWLGEEGGRGGCGGRSRQREQQPSPVGDATKQFSNIKWYWRSIWRNYENRRENKWFSWKEVKKSSLAC